MRRLCERPGCSEEASVAYGMRPQDLVFWLDTLADPAAAVDGRGVLCERHADSMVVPRNWTLDDLRDPDLHLFRPPPRSEPSPRRGRRRVAGDDTGEQLRLGVGDVDPDGGEVRAAVSVPRAALDTATFDEAAVDEAETVDANAPSAAPWVPAFDAADDLGGLLSASSPLLARAFRGADRPRRS